MKQRTAQCPACGAPVEFKVGSTLVTVCEFCQSAVARVDKKIEDYGKVADLVETSSPLRRGIGGTFKKRRFEIVGRVQYKHPAGGYWNEWYLAFPGNKWGWLAETQGKYYLMFRRQLSSTIRLPDFEGLQVGKRITFGRSEFTISEKGTAVAHAAEGDIPWRFRPGDDHRFVDLAADDDVLATFEYGQEPAAFVGKELKLEDLDLDETLPEVVEAKLVPSQQLNCPKCGGPLQLHVPDQTQRVTCQNCDSLLDVSGGKLQFFQSLKTHEKLPVVIPLGSEGTLFGNQYTVIGFLRRFAMYEGKTYPWSEYLLYNQDIGFRWLIHNEGHWSFAEPISANVRRSGNYVHYDNERFRVYDRGTAYVRSVLGEFYWQVQAGDQSKTSDFIAPPRMISFDTSQTGSSSEINVSLCHYLPHKTIEQAFGLKHLSRPWGIGVIQPRPEVGYGVFGLWALFLALIFVIWVSHTTSRPTSDPWMMFYAWFFVSLVPAGILFYIYAYEAKRWEDSDYSPYRSDS